ncbi:sulfurtransferase complex subunit TusD [Methylogaea oryzae]|uniref:Sulfurtransferase TusD n=1 Tax=Methylogaea oryzae TaxID=1295382 RepID=A0A8D5AJ69_9GAMM|nr:sulfurtransferase complex subunit TusD [Methylogaea oryzae]BBL70469.1 sulfurtransferase TusD [Methylogaea oryzae]
MKFALMVNGSPYRSQGALSACRFAMAAVEQGHQVLRVFFHGDGVYNAVRDAVPPADEIQLPQLWRDLARDHGVDLAVCSAAAERRGVLGEQGEDMEAFPAVADGFRVAGLGLWMDACLAADRVIVFHG